jgi:cytochrome P450
MIDELIGMIIGGYETIMISTVNTIMHLSQDPKIRARYMEEICPVLDNVADDFFGGLTTEETDKFEFTRQCWYEAMRICPPVSVTPPQTFQETVTFKGVTFTPKDTFIVN